jgi:hypothetical protein
MKIYLLTSQRCSARSVNAVVVGQDILLTTLHDPQNLIKGRLSSFEMRDTMRTSKGIKSQPELLRSLFTSL